MKIYILKGAIGSGKTTYLINYCRQKNVGGVLSPHINGKRHFLNIKNQEMKMMEASEKEIEALNIGRYKFSAKAFEANWRSARLLFRLFIPDLPRTTPRVFAACNANLVLVLIWSLSHSLILHCIF